ncbi:MAG: hypothetical protein ACSLE2_06240 [Lysobacterales bacterium]
MTKTTALPTREQTRNPAICQASRLLLLACAALLLAACVTTPKTDPVVERAQARWSALLAGDLETAYTYFSPGYRSTTSLIDYGVTMRTRPVKWTSAAYKDHSCEGSRCIVRFDIGFQVPRPVPGMKVWNGKDVVEDTWVQTEGQWWYLPVKQ